MEAVAHQITVKQVLAAEEEGGLQLLSIFLAFIFLTIQLALLELEQLLLTLLEQTAVKLGSIKQQTLLRQQIQMVL